MAKLFQIIIAFFSRIFGVKSCDSTLPKKSPIKKAKKRSSIKPQITKNQLKKMVLDLGGKTRYSGKEKTMYIKSTRPFLLEKEITQKLQFKVQLVPFFRGNKLPPILKSINPIPIC